MTLDKTQKIEGSAEEFVEWCHARILSKEVTIAALKRERDSIDKEIKEMESQLHELQAVSVKYEELEA